MPGKQSTVLLVFSKEKQMERISFDGVGLCVQEAFSTALLFEVETNITKSLERIKADFRICA
jgi:hypothetical protein